MRNSDVKFLMIKGNLEQQNIKVDNSNFGSTEPKDFYPNRWRCLIDSA